LTVLQDIALFETPGLSSSNTALLEGKDYPAKIEQIKIVNSCPLTKNVRLHRNKVVLEFIDP
jgi:hypothetical protein